MSDARTLAAVVRSRRLALGLSQQDLANRVPCAMGTIYTIEAGKISCPRILENLAKALGLTPNDLLRKPDSAKAS